MLRELAHLREQLGEEMFQTLISSDNTGKVKDFCDGLIKNVMPTEMTIDDHIYDILHFLKGGEKSIVGHIMVNRAKKMNANLGEDDGQYLLEHQQDIPVALRGKVIFVFPDWRRPGNPEHACYVYWNVGRWVQDWGWLDDGDWNGHDRLLRRK